MDKKGKRWPGGNAKRVLKGKRLTSTLAPEPLKGVSTVFLNDLAQFSYRLRPGSLGIGSLVPKAHFPDDTHSSHSAG